MSQCISLTGMPGIGKTTLIKRLMDDVRQKSINFSGFYTEEVRDDKNNRIGFDIISFDGERRILARHNDVTKQRSKFKVGQYHVFLEDLNEISKEVFNSNSKLIVIDEIGNMELMSQFFKESMTKLMKDIKENSKCLIVTVPWQNRRNHAIIEEIKHLKSGILFNITKQNRDVIYDEILENCLKLKT